MTSVANTDKLSDAYATDEHIYIEGGADFGVIVPRSNRYASGTDGVFASNARWTLTSATNDFAAQGVKRGMVVKLSGPAATFSSPQYLAVESVLSTAAVLRRCGFDTSEGQPPAPAAGLTGVTFEVLSLLPQIENTAYALNEAYAVDPRMVGRKPADIYDQRIFRRLTALRVLYLQYMNLQRSKAGDFADKVGHYHDEYESALASAILRWGSTGTDQPPTTRFSTRLSR